MHLLLTNFSQCLEFLPSIDQNVKFENCSFTILKNRAAVTLSLFVEKLMDSLFFKPVYNIPYLLE